MRMNFLDFVSQGHETRNSSHTIYYLKTAVPHLHDISIPGPYHNLEAVHAQARHNVGSECPSGRSSFEDMVQHDGYLAFRHVASQINDEPNRVKKISLVGRQDAELVARLPCPVWNANVVEMDTDLLTAAWSRQTPACTSQGPETRCSCLNESAGTEAAQGILQELGRAIEACVSGVIIESPFVAGILDTQSWKPRRASEVRYDQGSG